MGYGSTCMHNANYGYRIGRTTYKMALVELHLNNPEMRPGLTDGSGMKLYFTSNTKQNDLGTVQVIAMPTVDRPTKPFGCLQLRQGFPFQHGALGGNDGGPCL